MARSNVRIVSFSASGLIVKVRNLTLPCATCTTINQQGRARGSAIRTYNSVTEAGRVNSTGVRERAWSRTVWFEQSQDGSPEEVDERPPGRCWFRQGRPDLIRVTPSIVITSDCEQIVKRIR